MLAAAWVTAIATSVLALSVPVTIATWLGTRRADRDREQHEKLQEQRDQEERLTKAIKQLGSEELDTRLAGVYALERVARDSARDNPTVMQLLATFIREHSSEEWPLPVPGADATLHATRPDIQAAVTVLGRQGNAYGGQPSDLESADLRQANLHGVALARATLTGANLSGADLSAADLSGANLMNADLTYTDLASGNLASATLAGAVLAGARLTLADLAYSRLTSADLTGADLSSALVAGADLSQANLSDANLRDTSFVGARLMSADLTEAHLAGADFRGADLTDARWPERHAIPEGWVRGAESGRLERQ